MLGLCRAGRLFLDRSGCSFPFVLFLVLFFLGHGGGMGLMALQGNVVDAAEHCSEIGERDTSCVGLFRWVESRLGMRKTLLTLLGAGLDGTLMTLHVEVSICRFHIPIPPLPCI
jgi:hypothetical protein